MSADEYTCPTMKKTMMYLPDDMHRYLAREASERGTSMAEVAREAIAEYRSRRAAEVGVGASALVGCVTDDLPDTDLASQVDEGLAEYFGAGGEWEEGSGLCERS